MYSLIEMILRLNFMKIDMKIDLKIDMKIDLRFDSLQNDLNIST